MELMLLCHACTGRMSPTVSLPATLMCLSHRLWNLSHPGKEFELKELCPETAPLFDSGSLNPAQTDVFLYLPPLLFDIVYPFVKMVSAKL